jgi:hypothetical protein
MSDRFNRASFDESPPDEGAGDAIVGRRRLMPPILSVALVVAAIVGFAGLGVGYKLGQGAATGSAPSGSAEPASTASPAADLQADTVSERLQLAYQATSAGSWAICDLGTIVVCRPIQPSKSVSPAVHHTFGFTFSDMAALGQPRIGAGHIVLAAGLGEGVVTASLISMNAPITAARGKGLTPIDPGRSGVDYFDLGLLEGGTYGIVLGFIAQTGTDTSAPLLDSYLASFAVGG